MRLILTSYLVGPIQDCKDGGVKWREEITPKLEDLGINVIDPTVTEAKEYGSIQKAQDIFRGWISAGHRKQFKEAMWTIINRDMDAVYTSDFIIAVIDNNVTMGGTTCEVWDAIRHRRIPVYVVCYDALKDWNMWMLGSVIQGTDYGGDLFENFNQLIECLRKKYGKWGNKVKFQLLLWILFNRFWGHVDIVVRWLELMSNKLVKKLFMRDNDD